MYDIYKSSSSEPNLSQSIFMGRELKFVQIEKQALFHGEIIVLICWDFKNLLQKHLANFNQTLLKASMDDLFKLCSTLFSLEEIRENTLTTFNK